MERTLLAPPLSSVVDTGGEAFVRNRDDMLEQLEVIDTLLAEAEAGGGPERTERLRSRGKLPIRERIANALDPDSPFLEISALAGYDCRIYERPTTFALNVSNLFDKLYYRSGGIGSGSWGEPRTWRFSVRTDF